MVRRIVLVVASVAMAVMMTAATAVAQEDPKDVERKAEKCAEAQAELAEALLFGDEKDVEKALQKVAENCPEPIVE